MGINSNPLRLTNVSILRVDTRRQGKGSRISGLLENRFRLGLKKVDHDLPAVKKTKGFCNCVIRATDVSRGFASGRKSKTV